jgi:hypothetical protein
MNSHRPEPRLRELAVIGAEILSKQGEKADFRRVLIAVSGGRIPTGSWLESRFLVRRGSCFFGMT